MAVEKEDSQYPRHRPEHGEALHQGVRGGQCEDRRRRGPRREGSDPEISPRGAQVVRRRAREALQRALRGRREEGGGAGPVGQAGAQLRRPPPPALIRGVRGEREDDKVQARRKEGEGAGGLHKAELRMRRKGRLRLPPGQGDDRRLADGRPPGDD